MFRTVKEQPIPVEGTVRGNAANLMHMVCMEFNATTESVYLSCIASHATMHESAYLSLIVMSLLVQVPSLPGYLVGCSAMVPGCLKLGTPSIATGWMA